MSKVRIQVITVESDSSDPEVWRSIRRLIRRATMGGAVASVTTSIKPTEPVARTVERVREAVTEPPRAEPAPIARDPQPAPAPVAPRPPSAPPARRTEDDIRDVIQAAAPVADSSGAPPMLEDRILAAITRSPGVTADNLTVALLGKADRDTRRRVDMVLGNLQAAGKIMRANGQLFPQGYRGGGGSSAATQAPCVPGHERHRDEGSRLLADPEGVHGRQLLPDPEAGRGVLR